MDLFRPTQTFACHRSEKERLCNIFPNPTATKLANQ